MVQVGLFKSHYVVCTDAHIVRYVGGYTKSCGLSVFLFFVFFLFAFSELFIIVALMYLLRQDSLSSSLYVFFSVFSSFLFFFFLNPKAVIVTECSWL